MDTSKRTYLIFVLLVAAWCAGILLAPLLSAHDVRLGSFLYAFYSPICHQLDHRSFHLDGEKLGVCIRCSGIYFTFFVSLLLYPLVRSVSSPTVPHLRWLILAIGPMAVDVVLGFTGIHPSTVFTRFVTGILLGGILPLFLIPPLIEAVTQLRNRLLTQGGISYARKAE